METQLIDALYSAFADVPRPRKIQYCECCLNSQEISTLLEKDLRELAPNELSSYASSALLTVGDVADYFYFLPRILEILTSDEDWWPSQEVVGAAIAKTNIKDWPPKRRQALEAFFHEVIRSGISQDSGAWNLDAWICCIGRTELDVLPYLRQLLISEAIVVDYFDINRTALASRRLANGFWRLEDPGFQKVVNWFGSERVGDILVAHCGKPVAAELYYCPDGDSPESSGKKV